MINLKKYKEFLINDFNLSDIEADLYLGLLQKGPTTVLEISKFTEIKRATVHLNIENLTEKGLVTQTKNGRGNKRTIVAEPPERLNALLEERKFLINKTEKELPDMISSLYKSLPSVKKMTDVQVKYYEGKSNISRIYDEILNSKEVRAYVNSAEISKIFPDNFKKFASAAQNSNIELWDLQQYSPAAKKFYDKWKNLNNYHFKFFPNNIRIHHMDYLIYENTVTIIQGGENLSAVMINNKLLYENAKTIFDLMWSLLPEPTD